MFRRYEKKSITDRTKKKKKLGDVWLTSGYITRVTTKQFGSRMRLAHVSGAASKTCL